MLGLGVLYRLRFSNCEAEVNTISAGAGRPKRRSSRSIMIFRV